MKAVNDANAVRASAGTSQKVHGKHDKAASMLLQESPC